MPLPQAPTTRALLPVLGLGREPLLIEVATGKPMVVLDWETGRVMVAPEFVENWEMDVFLEALQYTPAPVIVRDWQYVIAEAKRIALKFAYRDDIG